MKFINLLVPSIGIFRNKWLGVGSDFDYECIFPLLHCPSMGQSSLKDFAALNFKMVIYRIPSRVGRSMGQPANAQLFDHEVRL